MKKELRQEVFDKYEGHCAYCGCELKMDDMQVDHIDSQYLTRLKGEKVIETIETLNPSCRQCNFYKGTLSIERFRNSLANILQKSVQKPFQFKLALKYDMVSVKEWNKKFYYEKFINRKNGSNLSDKRKGI